MLNKICKQFTLVNDINEMIKGTLRFCNSESKMPLIILLHGFKSHRNWGFLPYIAETFSNNFAITINFDASLNGKIEGEAIEFDDDKFSRQTISQYVTDLDYVIEGFKSGFIDRDSLESWNGEIYLLGHSLGSAVGLIHSHTHNKINKIALWGAISKIRRNAQRQLDIWKEQGFGEIQISYYSKKLKLNYSYIEDVMKYPPNFILDIMNNCQIPTIIVHGGLDLTVKSREANELYHNAIDKSKTKLVIVEKTGHTFGVEHIFSVTNPALEKAIESTMNFFELQ